MPYIVVVGRDLAKNGTVEIRNRRSGERISVSAEQAVAQLNELLAAQLS